jgi:hypothetical protein
MRRLAVVAFVLLLAAPALAQNTLSPTPYMGYNTFYDLNTSPTEANVKARADSLVSTGLAAAGYSLLSIDEGWSIGTRDGGGQPLWNTTNFPSGMAALATYIHGKGLKAGIYTDSGPAGTTTCGLASYTHYANDIDWFFNQWGYDMWKADAGGWSACGGGVDYTNALFPYSIFPLMSSTALSTISKPYILEGPTDSNGDNVGWVLGPLNSGITSVYAYTDGGGVDRSAKATTYILHHPGQTRPYYYPHADMLDLARHAAPYTDDQGKADFELKAIMSAPLMLGADPAALTAGQLTELTNSEIIAINQDPAVNGALRIGSDNGDFTPTGYYGGVAMYKYLTNPGERAVMLFNRSGLGTQTIGFTNTDIGLTGTFNVRDVRSHTDIATGVTSYSNSILETWGQLLKITAGTDTWTNSYKIATGSASAVGAYGAALNQVDGVAQSVGNTIDLTGCAPNCAPQGVYQTARIGQALLYASNTLCVYPTICAGGPAIDTNFVVKPGSYRVRMHFSENWKTAANQRKFNVAINNVQVLTDEDVFAEAGAQFKGIVKDFTITTTRPLIAVTVFPGSVDQAMISAVEIAPATSAGVPLSVVAH